MREKFTTTKAPHNLNTQMAAAKTDLGYSRPVCPTHRPVPARLTAVQKKIKSHTHIEKHKISESTHSKLTTKSTTTTTTTALYYETLRVLARHELCLNFG